MRRVFLDNIEPVNSNPSPQTVTPTDAELTNQINDEIISAYNAEKAKKEEADSNEEENTDENIKIYECNNIFDFCNHFVSSTQNNHLYISIMISALL